jgi:hypothetical protein
MGSAVEVVVPPPEVVVPPPEVVVPPPEVVVPPPEVVVPPPEVVVPPPEVVVPPPEDVVVPPGLEPPWAVLVVTFPHPERRAVNVTPAIKETTIILRAIFFSVFQAKSVN